MSYEVYTVEYIGQPNHVALYIETNPSDNEQTRHGLKYHVIGTILQGMTYQKQESADPMLSATYVTNTKKKIGTIAIGNLPTFEHECCNEIAPPGSQVKLNGTRKDPSKPLYRCNHWLDDVVSLAFQKGIFEP